LSDLFLALVDNLTDLLGRLTSAGAQILRPFASALRKIFPSFTSTLWGIQNAD
jgi:hypothetical protein